MKITTSGTQKEAQVVEIKPKSVPFLHYDINYDSTNPESSIRNFVGSIKDMIARYEYNRDRIISVESELVDLYHYLEISPFKNVPDGYKLYRTIAELRRERRACTNENDLLQPIYEYFHATDVLNKLSRVQGECAKCRGAIDARVYMVRTDILEEYLNPPVKPAAVSKTEEATEERKDPMPPIKTEEKPMSAFEPVWQAAN